MINIKKICNLVTASLTFGSLMFVPIFCPIDDLSIFISIAHAEVQPYTGTGDYIGSDDELPTKTKQRAKEYAIRNALEQAGIFISSQTIVKDHKLEKDEIITIASSILKVVKDNCIAIPLNEDGSYIKYHATVTVTIDTNELNEKINEWMNINNKERNNLIEQNRVQQRIIDEQAKRIRELEQAISKSTTPQDNANIRNEITSIDRISDASTYFNRAMNYAKTKNYKQAMEDYTRVIELNPSIPEAYYNRGLAYYNLKNYNKAIPDFTKYIQMKPNDGDGYRNCGRNYAKLKNNNMTISDFNKAIQLNSRDDISYYLRGKSYYDLKLYDQAISDLTKAIQLDPKYEIAYFYRGLSYGRTNKLKEALVDLNKAIQLNPTDGINYHVRGIIYEAMGDNVKAKADFDKAKQLGYNN